MDTYLRVNKDKFRRNKDKVLFTSTYLTRAAYEWFKPFIREYQTTNYDNLVEDTKEVFGDYSIFKKYLEDTFRDVNTTRNAKREIRQLKQTSDVSQYTSWFAQL
jgi:hypothetical protein